MVLPSHRDLVAYEVFARHESEPELAHVGQVHAVDDEDAVVFAFTLYDERRWQDLVVVPRSAFTMLIKPE